MAELLASIGTLAMILIGVAIILQIASFEEVAGCIRRAVAALLFAIVPLCILKCLWAGLMLPWLSTTLEFLKTLTLWVVITIVGFMVLLLVGRVVLKRFGRHLTLRRDPQIGDDYEIHDSTDTRN